MDISVRDREGVRMSQIADEETFQSLAMFLLTCR
jgi:hypothetical protein